MSHQLDFFDHAAITRARNVLDPRRHSYSKGDAFLEGAYEKHFLSLEYQRYGIPEPVAALVGMVEPSESRGPPYSLSSSAPTQFSVKRILIDFNSPLQPSTTPTQDTPPTQHTSPTQDTPIIVEPADPLQEEEKGRRGEGSSNKHRYPPKLGATSIPMSRFGLKVEFCYSGHQDL